MINRELTRQLQQLRALNKRATTSSLSDLELLAHWARYMCVLVAGFLENAIEEVYSDFVESASSPAVASFALRALARIRNPNAQRFLEVAGSFKDSWRSELDAFLSLEGRKDALDSILANRHLIAHGNSSGITIVRVNDYLDKCVQVIEFIESQCLGSTTKP